MIPYIDNELKVLKSIDRDLKIDWLGTLNKHLTMTQGKGQPHELFNNKTFLAKLAHSLKINLYNRPDLNKYLYNVPWMNQYYVGMFQIWTWGLNKVIYQLPKNLIKMVNEELDFTKIPVEPLFRLPQWSTMIDVDINAIGLPNFGDDYRARLILASIVTLDDKEYLNVRIYITPAKPEDALIIDRTTSIGFYVAKDAKTLEEGILKAESEIATCEDEDVCFIWTKLDSAKSFINDLLNVIMFINGEYSKSELKRSDVKWTPKGMPTGSGYKIRIRPLPVFQVIGEQYSALCTGPGTRTVSRASHFRKGHFCTYWLGPRNTEQTPIVHWIPPMQVKGSIKGEEND